MTKIKVVLTLLLGGLFGCSSNVAEISDFKRFGTAAFDKGLWNKGSENERARMLYSFLNDNSPINRLSASFIIDELGDSTGYYLYDSFPAYRLSSDNSEPFTVAFVIDHQSGLVKSINLEPHKGN